MGCAKVCAVCVQGANIYSCKEDRDNVCKIIPNHWATATLFLFKLVISDSVWLHYFHGVKPSTLAVNRLQWCSNNVTVPQQSFTQGIIRTRRSISPQKLFFLPIFWEQVIAVPCCGSLYLSQAKIKGAQCSPACDLLKDIKSKRPPSSQATCSLSELTI